MKKKHVDTLENVIALPIKKEKRGANDIDDFIELKQLIAVVSTVEPYYEYEPWKRIRDRALLALLALTGCRISELLSILKSQVDIQDEWVIIRNILTLKRWKRKYERYLDAEGIQRKRCIWKEREHILIDKPLPREGVLSCLTNIFLEYYDISKKGPLFDISRGRAWQIVNKLTGKWCHYFRSQRISYLIRRIKNSVDVADLMGIKSLQTLSLYYKGGWEHLKDELKE